ncbi:MAG: hypothetical protein BIFFINMI_01460 [Phycisphaerae bacterium]|nr:hypothetical protein [Phycisphaerae bacterium]
MIRLALGDAKLSAAAGELDRLAPPQVRREAIRKLGELADDLECFGSGKEFQQTDALKQLTRRRAVGPRRGSRGHLRAGDPAAP